MIHFYTGRSASDHFNYTRCIILGWVAFMADYIKTKSARDREPIADKYFSIIFFRRVCGMCFKAIGSYRAVRLYKKAMKKRGEEYYIVDTGRKVCTLCPFLQKLIFLFSNR